MRLNRCDNRRARRIRIQYTGRKIEVHHAIVDFGKWRNILVAHSQIKRQISAHLPLILRIQIPVVATEVVVACSKLHRSLLRQSQQKIGKVISRAWHGLATADLRSVEAGEDERAARITVRFRIDLHPPKVRAPAPGVLAMIPDHIVGKSIGLVSVSEGVVSERLAKFVKDRFGRPQSNGFCRDSRDSERTRNVVVEGV